MADRFDIQATITAGVANLGSWARAATEAGRVQTNVQRASAAATRFAGNARQSADVAARAWGGVGRAVTAAGVAALGGAGIFALIAKRGIDMNAQLQTQQNALGATLNAFDQYGAANVKHLAPQQRFNQALYIGTKTLASFEKIAATSIGTTQNYVDVAQQLASGVFSSGKTTAGLQSFTKKVIAVGAIIGEDFQEAGRDAAQMLTGSLQQDQKLYARALKPFIDQQLEVIRKTRGVKKLEFAKLTKSEQYAILDKALTKFATPAALARIGRSYEAAASTTQDFLDRTQRAAFSPLFGYLTNKLGAVNLALGDNQSQIFRTANAFGKTLVTGIDSATRAIGDGIAFISDHGAQIQAFFTSFEGGATRTFGVVSSLARTTYAAVRPVLELFGAKPDPRNQRTAPGQAKVQTDRAVSGVGNLLGTAAVGIGAVMAASFTNRLLGNIPTKIAGGLARTVWGILAPKVARGGLDAVTGARVFVTNWPVGFGGGGGGVPTPGGNPTPARGPTALQTVGQALGWASVGLAVAQTLAAYAQERSRIRKRERATAAEARGQNPIAAEAGVRLPSDAVLSKWAMTQGFKGASGGIDLGVQSAVNKAIASSFAKIKFPASPKPAAQQAVKPVIKTPQVQQKIEVIIPSITGVDANALAATLRTQLSQIALTTAQRSAADTQRKLRAALDGANTGFNNPAVYGPPSSLAGGG